MFRTIDGGKTWHELAGLRGHGTGSKWQPGAGGLGLHTILLDPKNPKRLMQRLRRLFQRARLEREEVNILRGILAAAQKRHKG